MKRYYVVFMGQVQGVGFRYTAYHLAYDHRCTGYVRNLPNGNVEMEIQGDTLACLEVIHKLTGQDRYIRVDDYAIKEISIKEDEKSFVYH